MTRRIVEALSRMADLGGVALVVLMLGALVLGLVALTACGLVFIAWRSLRALLR